jgi:homogentisate 1,2-dioxygenase
MSEFMGLIDGSYDAKKGGKGGFEPGGASLHGVGAAHGPDVASFTAATKADTSAPTRMDGGMAFMFETASVLRLTPHALDASSGCVLDEGYAECWEGLPRLFSLSLAQAGGAS